MRFFHIKLLYILAGLGAAGAAAAVLFFMEGRWFQSFNDPRRDSRIAEGQAAKEPGGGGPPDSKTKARIAGPPAGGRTPAKPLSRGLLLQRLKTKGLAASLRSESSAGFQAEGLLKLAASPQHRGKTVVINLWATWCAPCVEELFSLGKLAEKTRQEALVIAVSTEAPATVSRFLQRGFPDLSKRLKVLSLPSASLRRIFPEDPLPATYIFNKSGRLIRKESGARDWSLPKWISFIKNPL